MLASDSEFEDDHTTSESESSSEMSTESELSQLSGIDTTMEDIKVDKQHCIDLVQGLYENALENKDCDIELIGDGWKIGAHRFILVKASKYFEAMFSGHFCESKSGTIDLTESVSNQDVIREIMKYIYLGHIDIDTLLKADTIENILFLSTMMQLEKISEKCSDNLLANLNIQNCLNTWKTAYHFSLDTLEKICGTFSRYNFHHMLSNGEVIDLSEFPPEMVTYFFQNGLTDFAEAMSTEQEEIAERANKKSEPGKTSSEIDVQPGISEREEERQGNESERCLIMSPDPDEYTFRATVYHQGRREWYETVPDNQPPSDCQRIQIVTSVGTCLVYKKRYTIGNPLFIFNVKSETWTVLTPPIYGYNKSLHIFAFKGLLICFVAMPLYGLPFYQPKISSEVEDSVHSAESMLDLDFPMDHPAALLDLDDLELDPVIPGTYLDQSAKENSENNSKEPLDLSHQATQAHELAFYVLTDEPETIQESPAKSPTDNRKTESTDCPLRWKYVQSYHEPLYPVPDKVECIDIGDRKWLIAKSRESDFETPRCFYIEVCGIETDGYHNQGLRAVSIPAPPKGTKKATKPLSSECWQKIEVTQHEGSLCFRSKLWKIRYFCKFVENTWSWQHVAFRKSRFLFGSSSTPNPPNDPPAVELKIKQSGSKSKTDNRRHTVKNERFFYQYRKKYPGINEFWRYDHDGEQWEELIPPPFDLFDVRFGISSLRECHLSLDLVECMTKMVRSDENNPAENDKPFLNWTFDES